MNVIQKSEATKNGLRKGFQDKRSKIAKRKYYGYTINSDDELEINPGEADVVIWIFERYLAGDSLGKIAIVWKGMVSPPPLADPNGIGKRLANCFLMKNILAECCFKKQSAQVQLK